MNPFKSLITLIAVFLFTTVAFGQDSRSSAYKNSPAGTNGPVHPEPRTGNVPESPESRTVNAPFSSKTFYGYQNPVKVNQKLEARLKTLLPQNLSPQAAASGFGDLKDFVTAVRASNNLKISFWDLKHAMANGSSKSLEKAIHELKPDVTAKEEIKKARDQAQADIKESKRS